MEYVDGAARLSILNVPLPLVDISVARDKIVFPLGEQTRNIWMTDYCAGRRRCQSVCF